MPGRVYQSEEEFRLQVLRENETRKTAAGLFTNVGAALAGGGVVQVYTNGWADDPKVAWWFLIAVVLILMGLAFLKRLELDS